MIPSGYPLVEKFAPLFGDAPYIIAKGGRAGMKSHTIAEALLIRGKAQRKRVLCAREIQKSISESVHQLLRDKISKLGMQDFYQVTTNEILGRNGSQFLFAGLKTNFSSIKSKEGLDIVWVEEGAKVSKDSWITLLPTIRKEGSQLIVSFNPEDETDPVNELEKKPGAVVITVGWQDNPWISKRTLAEIKFDYANDPEMAEHVWGGGFRKRSKAQIFTNVRYERLVLDQHWFGPYYGADWGFAQDPVTLMKLYLGPVNVATNRRAIYIEKEAYGVGVELNEIPQLWKAAIPECRNEPSKVQAERGLTWFDLPQPIIRGDNSRPETIAHLRNQGFNVVAAEKWPGSVEDGVAWMKAHDIIVNPDCKHQEQEVKGYKFKEDPITGDVLPIIVDKHNHCWDADRYGLEPAIKVGEIPVVVAVDDTPTMILDEYDARLEELSF